MAQDKVKALYDTFIKEGYNMESEAEFRKNLDDPAKRKAAYEALKNEGYDMEAFDAFETNIGYGKTQTAAAQTAQQTNQSETPAAHTDSTSGQQATGSATGATTASKPEEKRTFNLSHMDKIRVQYEMLHGKYEATPDGKDEKGDPKYKFTYKPGLHDFNARSRARVEQARRMADPERFMPEGLNRRKSGEFMARASGTPTKLYGLTSGSTPGMMPLYQEESQDEPQTPVMSEQNPIPYGVVTGKDGKRRTQWLLPDGSLTTNIADADAAEYGARRVRLMNRFVGRMRKNGLDPGNEDDVRRQASLDAQAPMRKVLASVWADAEADDKADDEAYARETAEYDKSIRGNMHAIGPDGLPLPTAEENLRDYQRMKKHKETFNLEAIAQKTYEELPKSYRDGQLRAYQEYFKAHKDELEGRTPEAAAHDALKGEVYNAVYQHAVETRMPKSKTEFFLRKIADQPFLSTYQAMDMGASALTGAWGMTIADQAAMARYGQEHRGLDIAGTVVNMAMDPTTYMAGGIGSMAGKQALRLTGRHMLKGATKEMAERYAAGTLTGRLVQGTVGGAANFMTFETAKNIQQQASTGGMPDYAAGTSEGFSGKEVLNAAKHGFVMGGATGMLSPLIGNVADKAVKATTTTAGKMGVRGAELAVSTLAEGTVFSIPEWIEGDRDAMDVWTDNLAMMLGFKASHAVKTAPSVIRSLRPATPSEGRPLTREERIRNNKSFNERVRERLNASASDIGLTAEERDELRRRGYGDLSDLFSYDPEYRSRKAESAQPAEGDVKGTTGLSTRVNYEPRADESGNRDFDGYEAMERLIEDGSVSEATRAKAYYILTGRMLPMSTVTGWDKEEIWSEDPEAERPEGYVVSSYNQQNGVVTRRTFKTEKAAQEEVRRIERQVELNTIDVGEQYRQAEADFYNRESSRPEKIREQISEETGIDIDSAIKKEPGKRSEAEQEAVKRYARSLFPEEEARDERPEQEKADRVYEEGRLLYGRYEQGDPDAQADMDAISLRMREASELCEDAFGNEAEVYMAEMQENPWGLLDDARLTTDQKEAVLYYINARSALDGVLDASNEAAAEKREKVKAEVDHRTHRDRGMIVTATLSYGDKPVYIISGDVVMMADESMVDESKSSRDIIILDESGEYRFAAPGEIKSVDEPIDPQTELQAAWDAIDREQAAIFGAESEEDAQGELSPEERPSEAESLSPEERPADTAEYDRGYEQAIASTDYTDEELAGAIEASRSYLNDGRLDDFGRGRLEGLEYEQQRRAMEAQSVPETGTSVENGQQTAPQTALARIPLNEQGEPSFESVDREMAWDGLVEAAGGEDNAIEIALAQAEQATLELEALNKKPPTMKAPKLKGSPMAMAEAKRKASEQYQNDLAEYNQQIAEAQARIDAWNGIVGIHNSRTAELRREQEEERRQRDAIARDEAVARFEEEQRIKAEKQAEQDHIGAHAVNPKIKEKWDAAPKVEGNADAITLPDGSSLTGRYVLTEAGTASPSHDVNNGYQPTEGFPIDENGQSVNDRDYMRDKDAQQIVEGMASSYDNRALQDPVIVSRDGVVLSGNNRTMSGDLAAGRGTDKAYVDYLAQFGHKKYGFTPEQVAGMKNPRVVFVPDDALTYDATTFARFNAQEKKSQGKPEAAVKLGKIVPDNVFNSIVSDISRYDRLSDYYADERATAQALGALMQAGVINDKQLPEMRTGTALSAAGKELIENTLIGKVFQSSPDAVRQIISVPTLRQSIVMGLNEIANNRTIARNGYDITDELSKAVDLVARAKAALPEVFTDGIPVSPFGRMQGLFDDEFGDSRVSDATTLLLADLLNSGKPSDLRKILTTYNSEASQASVGQMDMFTGSIPTKEEILTTVNEHFRNATPKEQQTLVDAAIAERKRRAEADAEQRGRSEASEQTPHDDERRGEPQQPTAGDTEITELEPLGKDRNDPNEDSPEEAALRARISVGEEWEEEGPAPDKPIYKRKLYVDGKHEVIQTDAPDKNGSYTGSQMTFDGRDFGDLKEIADYIDGGMQAEPTEAQKAAGNYRMGHRRVDGYNISIENTKGSVRRGTGADGKAWETTMQNDYGYIRGTEGVDGDHIDVFLSDTPEEGDVFVVDQVNEDGSFDEHKVMYGFPTEQAARDAYLSNYEAGWTGLGAITHVSKEEFKKWIQSSRRKTKPFAEYKSVKVYKEQNPQLAIEPDGFSDFGPVFTQFKGNAQGAIKVLTELQDGEAIGALHHKDIGDIDLVWGNAGTAKSDGYGLAKLVKYHPEVIDHLQDILDDMHIVKRSENRINLESDTHKAAVRLTWNKERKKWLLTAFEKKETSEPIDKTTDTDENPSDPRGDTALSQNSDVSNGKDNTLSGDKQESEAESSELYSITPTTYTNKKGKTSEVHLVKFNRELTAEEKAALDTFAREPLSEGKKTSRGWYDHKEGGYMMRSVEAARQLAEMIGNEEAVADAQPMTAKELREATSASASARKERTGKAEKAPINRISLEDVMTDLQTRGETRLSDHAEPISPEDRPADAKTSSAEERPADAEPEQQHEISDEEMASLADELRDLLGIGDDEGNMDIRFRDPGELTAQERQRIQSAGIRLAMGLIERGTTAFPDYAAKMVGLLGNKIRPWLKSFYEGARWTPGYDRYVFTPSEDVAKFDTANFDKPEYDAMRDAEIIVEERKASAASAQAERELKETRNKQRREDEKQREADTAAIAEEAGAVASEAEATAGKKDIRGIGEAEEKIDKSLDRINEQLAILGYFEDDNRISTAEKKATRAGAELLTRLIEDLGLKTEDMPAGMDFVSADLSESGGYVRLRLPIRKNYEPLKIDIRFDRTEGGALRLTELMTTLKRGDDLAYVIGEDNRAWLSSPHYDELLGSIREQTEKYLPKDRKTASSPEDKPADASEATEKAVELLTGEKNRKSGKKALTLNAEEPLGGLFGDIFDEPETPKANEKETDVRPRPGTAERERGHEPESHEPLGESQRNEAEGTDGRGMGGRSSVNPMPDGERGGSVSRKPKSQPVLDPVPESERKNVRNNHAERGTDYAPKGEDARIKANMEAIELAKQLLDAGETATPAQMATLRKFSGWGGLGKAFNEQGPTPNPIAKRLKELLGEEGYQDAVDSRRSAYYTPAEVIDTMWDVARAMGFKGGNVLEGSAGIGNIIGLMPADMSDRSSIHAVEIDSTTGGILSLLYPDAKVEIQGFEKTRVQNGSVDLAITNVPFITGAKVFDETGDKDLSRKFHDIHDFCIAKNIRKLREGGIGIFITSSGTMDNSKELRLWITGEGNADVVGAFRMHNKTFGGTGTTSDIIVVRKRVNGKPSPNAIDVTDAIGVRVADYDTGDTRKVKGQEIPIIKQYSMMYNKYFAEHPENMAGEMMFNFERGETRFPTSRALFPVKEKEQSKMLTEWASSFADMEEEATAAPKIEDEITRINEQLGEGVKEGSMVLNSQGEICMARMGEAVPLGLNKNKVKGHTKTECFKAYSAIKKALTDVLEYQSNHEGDEGLAPLLKELNRAFDTFTRTYGNLHKNTAISFLRNDVDFSSILALETYSEKGDKKGNKVVKTGKTDIFSRRVIDTEKEPQPTTIKDAILASLYKSGGVDVEYIGQALGKPTEEVKREIVSSGLGFENPSTGTMEVSYKYLSGNVREKLHIAQENNADGRYDANIKALEGVMPMTIPAHLIEFSLGSSWIEPKLYEDFVFEKTGLRVTLTNAGGTWFMKTPWSTFNEKNRAMAVVSKMCDKTIMGHELIEAAITNRQITVSKTEKHYDGTTETITDKAATAECGTKVDEIRADFKDWAREHMQADPAMSARIEQTYNDQFNNYVPMSIPDEFVPQHFGGQVSELHGLPFALRPHQGKAVVRGTTEPILLAHEVGTGKTYTLITTAMEMRRLGTARKPMIVVQNATVGQFVESAKEIYPNAKVLTIEEADRTAEGRKNFYAKIKYNDWDMIVVPQSVFERIPDSEEREMAYVKDIIEEKMKVLEAMREADSDGRSMIVRQAERELAEQEARLAELTETMQGKKKKRDEKREATTRQNAEVRALEMLDREVDDVENFDDMGIDAILVDEAHEYKHLGFATAMQRGVKGVDPSYSKKSQGVFLKAQAVMERNNGRNVVFATGTPISNTAAEIWTFMRYLMPVDTMKSYGIYYFDDFVRNFGNIAQMVEFSTNGKFKENNRFAGYVNLPELVRIWSSVADTVLTREAGGVSDKIPDMEGGKPQDIYLPQTRALRSVMKYVKAELDRYDKMTGKEKKENSHIPLTMYGIAKAAAVDVRLVVPNAEDDPNSKTNATVRETLRSLRDSEKYKGTVAIFSDNYQNKQSGFNLYEDIRKKLIAEGVPAEQIVVIKPGMTVKRKLDIFEKVNAGEIRVIMGSTFTLGTGVNIQERLHTLIHVDAPNRPMDYTQRNGRALRQGNLHKDMGIPVRIIRFGVEDSLDVTAYQRLKTKGAIADSIMNGSKMMQNSMENRVLEEEEDSFGDMTAQLSGSEYAILKNQAEREVRNLTAKQKGHDLDQIYVHNQLPKVEGLIKGAERRIEIETKNLKIIGSHFPDGTIKKITIGKLIFDSVAAMEDFFKEQNAKMNEAAENVREGADKYTSKLAVDVDGLKFEVTTTVGRTVDNNGQGTLTFEPERNVTYSCEKLGIKDQAIKGNRLKNIMQKIAEDIVTGRESRELLNRGQQQLAHYTEERTQLEQRNGREFPYKQELAEAKERLAKYEEAMKKELAEKEAKYAELDKSVETASDITLTDEDGADTPTTGDGNKYRLVAERELLDFLEGQPLKKGYRYSQWANMGVLPPMTAKQNGEWRAPMIFSQWEQSEEGMRKENGKADLVQGNGRTTGDVAYNPYFHIRTSPLNDQFTAAYVRPELLVVEGYYPESEETSGYRAEGAKDSVGLMDWHSGSVNGQLSDETKVQTMLSRYFKPGRIVPWSEVADLIMERAGEQKITFPINAVPPMLRAELAKRGAKFGDISGSVAEADIPMLNELRDRVNAGEWDAGLEKARAYLDAYESSTEAKEGRVEDLAVKLNTPVRIIRDEAEIKTLPSRRERRAKGWWSARSGEVVVVLPNNVNVADVENTVVHEVVGHKGLRAFIGEERFDEFLGEVYEHASNSIRKVIDKMTDRMVSEEADRLRTRKAQAHERAGEDVNANYYTDMAAGRVEAEKKREDFRKEATEEYMADLGGRISEEGFEKMSRDELTLWGKIKAKVQAFLDKFLRGLKIAKSIRLSDKDLAYILYKSWKNLRDRKGKGGVFAEAEDAAMRSRTGWESGMEVSDKRRRIEKLRRSTPVEISGKEFEHSTDIKQYKKNALEYGKTLQGEYRNADMGVTIQLQRGRRNGGLKEILQHDLSDEAHIKSIAAIPGIIEHSIYIETQPNKDKDKNPDVRGYEHYVCGLRIADEDYTVHSIVASDKNGNRYYDHKLSHIEKGRLLDFIEAKQPVERILTPMPGTEPTIRSERKVKELISLLQVEDNESAMRFRDGGMGLEETITKMKADALASATASAQEKRDAMRAIGGNLNHLRRAMARQREYDVTTAKEIKDLARVLMEKGLLDSLGNAEVKSLLAQVTGAIGRKDISKQADRVFEIMTDNHLRNTEIAFGKLISTRTSRADGRGIKVQGALDPDGEAILKVFNAWKGLNVDEIDGRITEAQDAMSDPYAPIAERAALEYAGLQMAREYAENIGDSKKSERTLRDEIKKAKDEKDAGRMTADAFNQTEAAIRATIQQMKLDRVAAYESLIEKLGGELKESVVRAKAWREAEKERVNAIHHLANSDMEGRELRGDREDSRLMKLRNSWLANWLLEPMSTLDQMLKMMGSKNPNGEGYLQNHYMRGWVDAADREQELKEAYHKKMDEKAAEIFGQRRTWLNGGMKKVDYTYSDLYDYAEALPGATIEYYDGAEMREYEIGQGELLYLYAVDKMPMGRATNRRMGIEDATMQRITDALDPKLKEYADWVQDELLPRMGDSANEVHKRMFGADMDAIENYFPFVRDKNALKREVENGQTTQTNDRISVQTGAIKKRVASVAKWDMRRCNFMDVLAKHVDEMTHWIAFAELNRDFGTLLSYNRFKQQVFAMNSVYGAGEQLWKRFQECCAIATDAYEPQRAKFDRFMVQGAKGVTMGKISLRTFTALKQTLSLPAFFGEVNLEYVVEDLETLGVIACKWAWRNMPNFRKRILSRTAGDYRLKENEYDGRIMKASSYGMLPNIGVDAWTIAVGSHGVYQTRKAKYLRWGMDETKAERRAVQDAELCFNKSQQSSEGPFMAPVQVDHTFYATSAMLFRNSSTSYTREAYTSARNLKRLISGEVNEEYVTKQILRTLHPEAEGAWTDAERTNARKNAKREIRSAYIRNTVNLAMFGWILPWLWRIGGVAPLLLLSRDEEEKRKQWEDATRQSMLAPIEGLAYGDVIEGGMNYLLTKSAEKNHVGRENPFISDIKDAWERIDKDELKVVNDLINIIGGMAIGVNPQTITDWVVAIMDATDDRDTQREVAIFACRILNVPQSQIDKIYFDEIVATGDEASTMSPDEIAERYAEYKTLRNAPLTGWAYDEEGRKGALARQRKKAVGIMKERLNSSLTTERMRELLDRFEETKKREQELRKLRNSGRPEERSEYLEGQKALLRETDMRLHNRVKRYDHEIKLLTKRWLKARTAQEADSIAGAMTEARERMLRETAAWN